eukprot:scaffold144_cov94-Skeletonema_dohrnii-CCMP3373.AAC.11
MANALVQARPNCWRKWILGGYSASVRVAVEFLMGGSGGRPRCVCKRKNAMRSGALEGFEVHFGGVGFVGSKREWTNGVVGALGPCRRRDILPKFGVVWRLWKGCGGRLLSSLCCRSSAAHFTLTHSIIIETAVVAEVCLQQMQLLAELRRPLSHPNATAFS